MLYVIGGAARAAYPGCIRACFIRLKMSDFFKEV